MLSLHVLIWRVEPGRPRQIRLIQSIYVMSRELERVRTRVLSMSKLELLFLDHHVIRLQARLVTTIIINFLIQLNESTTVFWYNSVCYIPVLLALSSPNVALCTNAMCIAHVLICTSLHHVSCLSYPDSTHSRFCSYHQYWWKGNNKQLTTKLYMWQSQVENEHYSIF